MVYVLVPSFKAILVIAATTVEVPYPHHVTTVSDRNERILRASVMVGVISNNLSINDIDNCVEATNT